ncbi:hypothetical protein SSX86_016880 [Deinandra increscens subsp. villosa]|uniref:RRM domain-containing protein n=1 Tax=Deinandra increscens subsp. villosa TaxID=3103831 RepID=A0AAP0CU27_9ASTR
MNGRRREKTLEDAVDGEAWQTVRRRPINNRPTFSFFIARFPDRTLVDDLELATKHLGTVEDVFVARKRRYNNERFGFIRFKNLLDVAKVKKRLNEVKIGESFLKENVSKVPRSGLSTSISRDNRVKDISVRAPPIP